MFSFSIYSNRKIILALEIGLVKTILLWFNEGKFEIASQISPLKGNDLTIDKNAINAFTNGVYP